MTTSLGVVLVLGRRGLRQLTSHAASPTVSLDSLEDAHFQKQF